MKKYLLLFALACLLGNRALAQGGVSVVDNNDGTITETIDFTGLSGGSFDWSPDKQLFKVQGVSILSLIDKHFRIATDQTNGLNIGSSDAHNGTKYLQCDPRPNNHANTISILNLKIGDKVRIYGVNEARVTSRNTDKTLNGDYNLSQGDQEFTVVNNSNLDKIDIYVGDGFKGIRKVEITTKKKTSNFDYDPGFEVYDMWSTRSGNNSFTSTDDTNTEENEANAGFQLNGSEAQYVTITNYKATLNNRIAVSGNNWNAQYGLMPSGNSEWFNFSICNLREGDRVVLYYTEEAPKFSSNGENGGYNGSAAFRDTWNDGVLKTDYILDDEKDQIIKAGDAVVAMHSRPESNIGGVDLYTSYPYTVMENGHLDFAIKNDGKSRIVKVKIYSDHQAMMVDDTDEQNFTYKSYFNITGELQAKEHIMPGGLEIHVGNTDPNVPDQNAVVVASDKGPVSYVKAVDGYKIPGITKSGDNININFKLHDVTAGLNVATSNIPKTGTFYKFMPEQDGDVTVEFQARSMNYYRYDIPGDGVYYDETIDNGNNPWYAEWDRPNEQTRDLGCPYYLVTAKIENGVEKIDKVERIDSDNKGIANGAIKSYQFNAKEDRVYYLYGAWRDGQNGGTVNVGVSNQDWRNWNYNGHSDNINIACGVAELLSVEFSPKNGVFPLSKWVKNGTEAVDIAHPAIDPDDLSTPEYELATIKNYKTADITVKKMSGNITECRPYIVIDSDGKSKLRIDGIKFAKDKNPGGTILMKLGNTKKRSSPVFALTIAYSTDPKYDEQQGSGIRGHVWDYSTYSLNGLTWDTTNGKPTPANEVFTSNDTKYAVVTNYGTSQTNDLLKTELGHGDWLENYNLIYNGVNYDKIFLNKYDVEGDNADVYWDSEGMVLKTSANQSGMNNEYGQTVSHSESKDPDRYIGILEGGEFRIPWLMKNDRVIIWMGTGKGRFADEVKLNIRNAYDAMHKPISESDEYIVGGSHWDGEKGDPYYRGCYHFFATGNPNDAAKPADMVFKMKEGSLCKIYKIQIYRGDRIITNEIVGETEANNKFFLWSRAYDPNDTSDKAKEGEEGYGEKGYTDTHNYNWALKYLGKDQQLANGTGKNSQENEIIAQTGKYELEEGQTTPELINNRVDPNDSKSKVESFTYKHQLGEIGTFRVRGKDMEKNMNYVADYADHNVTIAYQETMKYPYTWDFMDMTGFDNIDSRFNPEAQIGEEETAPEGSGLTDDVWGSITIQSYQKSARDLSLWEEIGDGKSYYLRLNSQTTNTPDTYNARDDIFETAQEIDGNQVWANKEVVPETQGLWFYTPDNIQSTAKWIISPEGMDYLGRHMLVVPNVPDGAAVYLRMKTNLGDPHTCTYRFGKNDAATFTPIQVNGKTDEWIVAIKNNTGAKSHLTLTLTGYQLKKLGVSLDPKAVNSKGWTSESRTRDIDAALTSYLTGQPIKTYFAGQPNYDNRTLVLTDISNSATNHVMPANTGCVLYSTTDGKVEIIDGGFHLFVPDMHDKTGKFADPTEKINGAAVNMLKPQLTQVTPLPEYDGTGTTYTNYVLSYKHYKYDASGNYTGEAVDGPEMFYRVANTGIGMRANSAYLPLLTDKVKPSGQGAHAKYSFLFADWDDLTFDEFGGIATGVEKVEGTSSPAQYGNEGWYTINGQKLSGKPTTSGLYIINGKKVVVK